MLFLGVNHNHTELRHKLFVRVMQGLESERYGRVQDRQVVERFVIMRRIPEVLPLLLRSGMHQHSTAVFILHLYIVHSGLVGEEARDWLG